MFTLEEGGLVLVPEVTNYVRAVGAPRLGTNKVFYVARCFRDETTTDATRLREFTQIGVEILGDNALDCRKTVRWDAIRLFTNLLPSGWKLVDGVERGLKLYDDSGKTFEIIDEPGGVRRQLLGGGPYVGGAGWALGLERLMAAMKP
jgi:histidyl-tRNA synthetase